MGVVANISYASFPKQSECIGKKVSVCFHYDTAHCIDGIIVRDDAEAPYRTIIQLVNGAVVLSTERQYTYPQ